MKTKNCKSIMLRESTDEGRFRDAKDFRKSFLIVPALFFYGLLCWANPAYTADPLDVNSQIGDTVINPLIEPSDPPTTPPNNETTVTGLNISLPVDPFDYTQFVFTGVSGTPGDNEYSFLVRGVGENIYQYFDETLYTSTITSIENSSTPYTSPTVTIIRPAAGSGGGTVSFTFDAWQTYSAWLNDFSVTTKPTEPDPDIGEGGSDGIKYVLKGARGGNGHDGALFVPAGDGHSGGLGPSFIFNTDSWWPATTTGGVPIFPWGLNPLDFLPSGLENINAVNKKGLYVASIGGRGGDGGDVYLSPSSGGDGGNGGAGGNVTLLNYTQSITTSTTNNSTGLHGIFVKSQSGRGGNGGSGFAAIGGGSGGGSPDGGNVTIKSYGDVVTDSKYSYGIYGLSVSGSGGSGGDQYGLAGSAGSGGGAADGGVVYIENAGGTVWTKQDWSYGILAQSIGGTGGSSGDSGNLIYTGAANGQNGGNGGKVTIINEGQVFTDGINSQGLSAQSIGGGGGNSGSVWGLVAIGGTADNGGNGDDVIVENRATGLVQTQEKGSTAIFAQSVGGSGGRGSNAGGLVALGGKGAKGGSGGTVDVTNAGEIKTFGDISRGIFAESVGGGGGSGGNSIGMISVGGIGAGGGDGKDVTVVNSGTITTAGDYSEGIYAQSVGGGGGDGGTSTAIGAFLAVAVGGDGGTGGKGGNVDIILGGESPSIIKTGNDEDGGYKSVGIFAQSVGGGGGSGGGALAASVGAFGSVSVALGGKGAKGGDGGIVSLTTAVDSANTIVSTKGDHATGIYLQSVGGGGGDGGYAYSFAAAAGPVSGTVNVGIGGRGGKGGAGGEVTVGSGFAVNPTIDDVPISPTSSFKGNIFTDGERSTGLFAQSVGGGGGNGGLAISAGISASAGGSFGVSVGLGGNGGVAGDGGVVRVATEGDITTNQAQSTALLVQSVGGGGGNGGGTVAAGAAASGGAAATINVGGGGEGATGGDGGEVTLMTGEGNILTKGIRLPDPKLDPMLDAELLDRIEGGQSPGIIVQSVGGGGGNGGYAVAAGIAGAGTAAGAVTVGLGGGGGSGGDGGKVFAQLASNVTTEGDSSTGILAQSVGGGGGNGGFSVSAAGAGAGTGAGAISVGLGGSGAAGGTGGDVIAASLGNIVTKGARSAGFIAQSIGGGGGNGGFNVSGGLSGAGTGSGAISVGLGGDGGSGNDGGNVIAKTEGKIATYGGQSSGVMAQSVGGGGGSGGFNVSGTGSGAGTGSGSVSVGLGGTGAGGGKGCTVDLTVNETVDTEGDQSIAVIAQSIGGGGGNGGFNVSAAASGAGTGSGTVGVGLGGSGGGGGDGGVVIVSTGGNITTKGVGSAGILAQSVGGGGGNGGFNVTVSGSGAGTGSGAVGVGLGGSGEGGGNASTVNLTVNNNVTTTLANSAGIIAQSVGGGGGNGGFDVTVAGSGAGTGSGAVSVSLGGSAGTGGFAGDVTANVTGDIVTGGNYSTGLLAQSVGGGGGNGGFSVSVAISGAGTGSGTAAIGIGGSGGDGGDSANVNNTLIGNVFTSGTNASGIIAQSLGGGGGNGGLNVTGTISAAKSGAGAVGVGIGGSGGGGGNSDKVINSVTGYVQTLSDDSIGILAQSLGGGGGNGGLNVTGTITAASTGSGGVSIGVGGFGGDGGDAGDVTNTVIGGTVTTGDKSSGIVAQSLGGGGGNGGINVTGAVNLSKENGGTLGVGIGGFGGDGGDAGNVISTVTTTEEYDIIATTGNDSSAVIAQSIGGGGGNGGLNVTGAVNATGKNGAAIGVGVGGFGGGAGNAGDVTLGVSGTILTEGNNSHGLLAQSVGGGGGNGGTNVTGSLSIAKPASGSSGTTVAASIGVGGFGGGGGNAGDVEVDFTGTVVAQPRVLVPEILNPVSGEIIPEHYVFKEGTGSHGILAQSLGGGGGNGGINVSGGISYAAGESDGHALLVGVGGFGGTGGNAGDVTVTVDGNESVSAYGAGHSAILAQSTGGGGGNGGLNVSGGIVSDSPLIVGVGGMGGNGGTAGDVRVEALTDVYASAEDSKDLNSAGIFAQSLGGGGGNGGLNVSGGISLSKEKNVPSITVGVGGFGGDGAVSGNVDVEHTGVAVSSGAWIHGIMAQSVGGGGGNGALNVSGQINWADSENSGGKTDLSIVAGIGGHGGLGADAGDVSIASTGTIMTAGDYARGIFAQSIGGGGGNGGMNVTGIFAKNSSPVSLGIGGFGSGGGDAGEVHVTRGTENTEAGLISTDGIGAIGIEASSIGGGGGDAGMNFIVGISLAGSSSGGEGGTTPREHPKNTGVDDSVFTNFDAVLDELEGKSPADEGDTTDANKESAFAAQIAIGGAGGEAGHGSAVSVDNHGDILTTQDNSHGIMGQSIGGGGGNASLNLAVTYQGKSDKNKGFNLAIGGATGDGGNGAAVEVNHDGFIETFGDNSYGVLAQSIGGGGGNAGLDVEYSKTNGGKVGITLGRRGGTGGFGGNVILSSSGSVVTHGNNSFGLLAQSIGNGGGNSSATSVSLALPEDDTTSARTASIAVGLEGGEGGAGGDVTLNAEGWVNTDGENAHGIFAQSVGGGGGNGGSASGFAVFDSTAALSVGGAGGQGGIGGTVTVISSADVRTNNRDSVGILAQSVGGGGGTGGAVRSGGLQTKGSGALVSVGGSGGSGMAGGMVTVDNSGVIITDGANSHGVLAQSLGGGGGNGGMVINSIYNKDADKATQINVSVGGEGGDGAISQAVTVTNTGGIGTSQENSVGILAQSIGGGGGNASTVITGSISGSGAGNKISLGIGGSGGTGGAAGDVTVANVKNDGANSGEIITLGNYSHGILAMSVGGGGGTGSTTITSNYSGGQPAKSSTSSVAFSLGGAGGDAGTGGDVDVTNSGGITTYGYKAHGIVAESVGGGGGSGGMSIAGDFSHGATEGQDSANKTSTISIGGSGGSGNIAGDVTVNNSGSIELFGDRAYGIYAQSVGGGGGNVGFSTTLSRNLKTNPKDSSLENLLGIFVGGSGGDGADSGNVLVEHTGSITAHGDNSYGIFAQTISGGGGNGGISITNPAWMAVDYTVSNLLGAHEGSNGTAGTVTINTSGDIVMLGANSQAQFAQSVNGGGGNMDFFLDVSQQAVELGDDGFELPDNSGDVDKAIAFVTQYIELGTTAIMDAAGSAIDATHVGDLYTTGKESIGSLIQSIGGGGGSENADIVVDSQANVDLVLALGGAESSGSPGGNVNSTMQGNITTTGNQSQAATVQSIGGGGGNLTVNVQKVAAPETPVSAAATSAPVHFATAAVEPAGSPTATVMLGADASFNNDGGDMNLTFTGDLSTEGDLSAGQIIQSIGAGGGQLQLTGLDSLDINIGATGNSSGNGGNIEVANEGNIVTAGELSHGIMIQSIGGGGCTAFTDLDENTVNLTLNSDNSGDGGNISFEQTGDIIVSGDHSIGVFAQSLGGGGGVVDRLFADTAGGAGNSGAITLDLDGSIEALGQDGVAVFAQSRSGANQGNINVILHTGKRLNFGTGGTGIWFSGGAENSFVNYGTAAGENGLPGWTVRGEEGDEAVHNYSTFLGQFNLGTGVNGFTNYPEGIFVPGPFLSLGDAANLLTQNGQMMPGDLLHAQHTTLTGSFLQSATGLTFADLDFGSENPNVDGGIIDSIFATGTIDLAGELNVALVNPQLVPYGRFQKTMFQGGNGLTNHGMVLTTAPSVVISYDLVYPGLDAAALDYNVDFSPAGMGRNLQQVGDYFNRIQSAGSSPELADTVIRLLYEPDMGMYSELLSQMSPEFYGELQAEQLRRSQRFTEILAEGGAYRFAKKDRVVWFHFEKETNGQDATADLKGAKHYTDRYAVGFQNKFNDRWTAGIGLSVEDNESESKQKQWTSDGDALYLGASLKREFNNTHLTASISNGWAESNVERRGQITEPFLAETDRDYNILGGMLRASHTFYHGQAYFRPIFDLGLIKLKADKASENGADGVSFEIEDYSETYSWMRPAIALGYAHPFNNGWEMRMRGDVGFHYYFSGAETYVRAGFAGAPLGAEPMDVLVDFDQSYTLAALGINLLTTQDISLGLRYSKIFGDRSDLNRWSMVLKIPF